jgi:hypothetical protein
MTDLIYPAAAGEAIGVEMIAPEETRGLPPSLSLSVSVSLCLSLSVCLSLPLCLCLSLSPVSTSLSASLTQNLAQRGANLSSSHLQTFAARLERCLSESCDSLVTSNKGDCSSRVISHKYKCCCCTDSKQSDLFSSDYLLWFVGRRRGRGGGWRYQ